MKFTVFLLISLAFVSCSHSDHDHSPQSNKEGDYKWSQEHKKIKEDYQRTVSLFRWFESHIKEHRDHIKDYDRSIKRHEKKLRELGTATSLEKKKLKLEFGRKHKEMTEEHGHYLDDHKEFMMLVKKLEGLKEELESHEGHHH